MFLFSFVKWMLHHLNYGTITILMFLESTLVPVPSELVIVPAAYEAASGHLNIGLIILFATIGADIGAVVNYFIAFKAGRPLIYRFVNSKWGKLCLLNEDKMNKAELYFIAHGSVSTLLGRLIPGIRHLISIPAGLSRMPLRTFLQYTTIGALIWNTILAFIGYHLQKIVPKENIIEALHHYQPFFTLGFIFLSLILFCYLLYHMRKKD